MPTSLGWLTLGGLHLGFVLALLYSLKRLALLANPVLYLLALSAPVRGGASVPHGRWESFPVRYMPKLFVS